jgi:tetratricopeptide (TPR) repeat protein
MQTSRYLDAAELCDQLLLRDPHSLEALRICGAARLLLQQYTEAADRLRRAVRQQPDDPALLNNLGMALERSGAAHEAVTILRAAAARHPNRRDILLNLSTALQQLYALDEAAAICEKLLSVDGRDAYALCNLGGIHRDAGRLEPAISCFERAIAADPQLRQAHEYLAYALLLAGDLARGWRAFESRQFEDPSGLSGLAARWDGDPRSAESLTLIADQGFGDAIQFTRYGAPLNRAGSTPSLQCHPRMVSLLRSCGYFKEVLPWGSGRVEAQTRWFPLLSLPLLCGTELATIPAKVPYLSADPRRVAEWRARLPRESSLRVGIAWQGNPKAERTALRDRSVPLAHFAPLAAIPNVQLFSLQKFDGLDQIASVEFAGRICTPSPELDAGEDAFLDTAALMSQLDLIICSDSSIAHLAGAMGRPVWVALKYAPDWRWLLDREDSPWYPSMRLFRQPSPQQWPAVFTRIADRLRQLLAERDLTSVRA